MHEYILSMTENALDVLYAAYRQCYSADTASNIFYNYDVEEEDKTALIKKGIRSGHLSPLEHVSFTFSIEGVSRALTHQLVRHRLASYSQQSQRYVNARKKGFYCPEKILAKQGAYEKYENALKVCRETYLELLDLGIEKEDARYILPEATESNIVVTMNCRELLHFFEERCCNKAQDEICVLAWNMLYRARKELPAVFKDAGPKCKRLGYCPEENGCGLTISREQLFGKTEQSGEEEK